MEQYKPAYKKWWFWIIIIVIMIGITVKYGGTNSQTKSNEPTKVETNSKPSNASNNTAQSKPIEATPKIYKVGETAKLKGMELTVTKVLKSDGNEYDKPKSGNEFIIVHIKIQNKGDKNIKYNPLDYKLQNSKGQIITEAFTTIIHDTALSSGELASNGEVEGDIAFEEPKNDPKLILMYNDNAFNKDEKISIELQ